MKLFGFEFRRTKAAPSSLGPVYSRNPSWFGGVLESFSGAWQRNIVLDDRDTMLSFSAVYACVTIIANDISKLDVELLEEDADGIYTEADSAAFSPVLRKPNRYQNHIKFIEQWVIAKLLYGNAYILKQRDARRIVTALYPLDPRRVQPLVAENGDVYYRLNTDTLSLIEDPIVVPASEVIHDMMTSLWHPLVGVSPLYACGLAATMGNKIQNNSAKFFENMSRPSGHLTAPGTIEDETAERLKRQFETMFSGDNIGRLLVTGDDLKYEPMTIPPAEAQLIEQLKFSVEDVARAFHMPMYKLGGPSPTLNNIEALAQTYYSDCLQPLIESIEVCLEEGLSLPSKFEVEFDLDDLLRMDTAARYKTYNDAIGAGWFKPNEARRKENLSPVEGGDTPYMQQQNYSLAALARRDEKPTGVGPTDVGPTGVPASESEDDAVRDFADVLIKALTATEVV